MVQSPITNSENVELKDSISSSQIISLYKNDFGIDVSRLFHHCETVSIFRCNDTGLFFYYPRNIDGDELFYDEIKKAMSAKYNSPYYSEEKWEYEICAGMIKKEDKVYEIGAGNGAFLKKLREKGVNEIQGSELNMESIKDAEKQNITIKKETVQEKANEGNNVFDIVCSFQVLEHVAEIHSFLESCLAILKPGGKLMLAVPYNNPYLFNNDRLNTLNLPPHHMNLWNRESFKKLPDYFPVQLTNFIIEKLATGGYDLERYYEMNKDHVFAANLPFSSVFHKIYYWWLKLSPVKKKGKNMIAVYQKM